MRVLFSLSLLLLWHPQTAVAVDVIGTEYGTVFESIVDYRLFIDQRLSSKHPTDQAADDPHHETIQAELIKRLQGDYPIDPTPLVVRQTDQFVIEPIQAPMPGGWCVIGHDAVSIAWLERHAPAFNDKGVVGCFLISVADPAGFDAMTAIVPVPLYRVQGQALSQIHAFSEYPVVLMGESSVLTNTRDGF